MKLYPMHFYLYRGNWFDLFYELTELLGPNEEQKFAIWEPVNKMREHCLVIIYGMPLAYSYCYQRNIWETNENIFTSFYLPHIEEFRVVGYKGIAEMPLKINEVA